MACVSVSTELLYAPGKRSEKLISDYKVDFWREVKKRWLVFGVLLAVTAAVLTPRAGAPGGNYCMLTRILHTEYLRYLPLWYIYYSAGRLSKCPTRPGARSSRPGAHTRLTALCILHAHVVAPALCVITVEAFKGSGIDQRIIQGAVLSSAGAGCGWVSVSLRPRPPAPALAAASWAASLLAQPALMIIMCGRATIPPLGGLISTVLTTVTPYAIGALLQQDIATKQCNATLTCNSATVKCNNRMIKMCLLLLLYVECCERLREAEGSLFVGDVLVTLMLVLCWLWSSVAACALYGRAGLRGGGARGGGARGGARALAACSVHKCLDMGWESSTSCVPSGLSRLPAVFIAPAQALILAAYAGCDSDEEGDRDDDDILTVVDDSIQ